MTTDEMAVELGVTRAQAARIVGDGLIDFSKRWHKVEGRKVLYHDVNGRQVEQLKGLRVKLGVRDGMIEWRSRRKKSKRRTK